MLIRELVARLLELLANLVGIHGLAIGGLAAAVVALYYMREAASLFVVIARYARMLSIIGFIVLALYVGGVVTGVVETGVIRSLLGSLAH